MGYSTLLLASTIGISAQAVCVDHNPIVKTIATKMGYPQFGACSTMGSFCSTEIPLPEMSITELMDIPGYDSGVLETLKAKAKELQQTGKFTLPNLLALSCPVACNICEYEPPAIDHIAIYEQNRQRLIDSLDGVEDLILDGLSFHPCNTGSHGCDKTHGGVCYKSGEAESDEWECGCEDGYICTRGCATPFDGHACERTYSGAPPAPMPTPPPTSPPTKAVPAYSPIGVAPVCKDHDNVVVAVASSFGASSCGQVKDFCTKKMLIPPSMVPKAGDPRRAAIPPALLAQLEALLQQPPLHLDDVLSVACPRTCQSGCAKPADSHSDSDSGSESGSSPSPSGGSAGACSPSDLVLWRSSGEASMEADMTRCTMGCLANPDGAQCIAECMHQQPGYSQPCGDCFGNLGECTKDKCLMQCLGSDKQACNQCVESSCSPAFEQCSGIRPTSGSDTHSSNRNRRSLRGDPRRM